MFFKPAKVSFTVTDFTMFYVVHSMYSVSEGEDVNGTAKFCVPCDVSLKQFAINSARQQFFWDVL